MIYRRSWWDPFSLSGLIAFESSARRSKKKHNTSLYNGIKNKQSEKKCGYRIRILCQLSTENRALSSNFHLATSTKWKPLFFKYIHTGLLEVIRNSCWMFTRVFERRWISSWVKSIPTTKINLLYGKRRYKSWLNMIGFLWVTAFWRKHCRQHLFVITRVCQLYLIQEICVAHVKK